MVPDYACQSETYNQPSTFINRAPSDRPNLDSHLINQCVAARPSSLDWAILALLLVGGYSPRLSQSAQPRTITKQIPVNIIGQKAQCRTPS
jgi:hypothetical protein